MPKVSVLMPIYNTNEKHLRVTIESILNQTYADFEFLILNDSPENTLLDRIVSSYADERITYLKNKENIGITASRNKLIKMAKGDYLAVCDHDDISLPLRFEKEVLFLDNNPDIGVVSCNFHKIVANKDIIQPEDDSTIRYALMNKCVIAHSASMIKKSVLMDNNIFYEKEYSPSEDYQLWCRLIGVTKFYNIQEILFLYRDHENNTTHCQKQKMEEASFRIKLENKINYPVIYQTSIFKMKTIISGRLFGFIPLIKTVKQGKRTKIYLFNFILIWQNRSSIKF